VTELVPKLIAYGLGAAVSPVAVIVLLTLMMRKDPLKNALIFLVGFTIMLVAIGVVMGFVLHFGGSGEKSAFDDWVDVALGAVCLALIPVSLLRKKKDKGDEEGAEKDQGVKASRAFVLGMATMAVNTSTMVIYAAGMHAISQAGLGAWDKVLAVALLTLVTLLSLLVPIFIYMAAPDKAGRVLASLKGWLDRHKKVIGAGVLAVFGVYLLAKGLTALL
jgi:threonine/homoserine/homoserine lactone efflux protein